MNVLSFELHADHLCCKKCQQSTNIVSVVMKAPYLKCIARNSSKERWEPAPVTQTGTCGKITHLSDEKINHC
jgi:hypothetical protein